MIGDYNIGKVIGEGAFSKVKLGVHNKTGKKVAIKIINKKMMQESNEKSAKEKARRAARKGIPKVVTPITSPNDSEAINFINSLENEVQLLMRLDHPNVIKTYQVIDSEEECYVVMQYASGGEMMEYLAMRGALSEREAKKFFSQLVSGLDHIHAASIVHRDMKLENLLLDEKNNLLITDFGLGRTFDTDRMHLLDTFCGTPHYAAVELVSGIPYIGIKSDIWALGVILYFLVAGVAPFRGSTIAELYDNIKSVNYEVCSYFSPELTDLLSKILQKNPIDRITLDRIRAHKWMEGEDCPIIAPKVSGKVDSSKLGQIVKSINSEKSYICYTFNNHEPVSTMKSFRMEDVSKRQRSNSALIARRKSISIGVNKPTIIEDAANDLPIPAVAIFKENTQWSDNDGDSSGSKPDGVSDNSKMNASLTVASSDIPRSGSFVARGGRGRGGSSFRGGIAPRGTVKASFTRKAATDSLQSGGSFFKKAAPIITKPSNITNETGKISEKSELTESHHIVEEPFVPKATFIKVTDEEEPNSKTSNNAVKVESEIIIKIDTCSNNNTLKKQANSRNNIQISKENLAALDTALLQIKSEDSGDKIKKNRTQSLAAKPVALDLENMDSELRDEPTILISPKKQNKSISVSPEQDEVIDSIPSPTKSSAESMAILAKRISMVGSPDHDNTENGKLAVATAKLKLEDFAMEDVIAWHEMHRPPKKVRSVKFAIRKGTFSILDTSAMFQDVHKVLMGLPEYKAKTLTFKRHPDYYNFNCHYQPGGDLGELKFDVEICKVWLLDLHAVKIKRRIGDSVQFKHFYDLIVKELCW